MIDQATRAKLKLILAQVRATEDALEGVDGTLGSAHPLIRRVNSLISRAKEALKGSELEAAVPSLVSPVGRFVFGQDLGVATASLRAGLEQILAEEGDEAEDLRRQVEVLTAKVAEAETRSLNVVDDELRDRCVDLLLRPGKADTAVRDAGVVFEHRIRKAAGLGAQYYGVGLVDKALGPRDGVLDFGGLQPEREGIHQLYRGVMAFFKNPTSHRIIEDYDVTRARQVVGLVDLLLQLLRDAKKKEPSADADQPARP